MAQGAEGQLKNIFLSAGIPSTEGHEGDEVIATDLISIRDAVRALSTVSVSKARIVYGGQPVITGLIHEVMANATPEIKDHIILYQSEHYEDLYPEENDGFLHKVFVEQAEDKKSSLAKMRKKMLTDRDYDAAVFIGGSKGVSEEFKLLKRTHPEVPVIPLASTGGASAIIYEQFHTDFSERLESDLGYMSIFRELLDL
jgi:hypothetical protein